jgi:hypothetical protein
MRGGRRFTPNLKSDANKMVTSLPQAASEGKGEGSQLTAELPSDSIPERSSFVDPPLAVVATAAPSRDEIPVKQSNPSPREEVGPCRPLEDSEEKAVRPVSLPQRTSRVSLQAIPLLHLQSTYPFKSRSTNQKKLSAISAVSLARIDSLLSVTFLLLVL